MLEIKGQYCKDIKFFMKPKMNIKAQEERKVYNQK